MRLTLPEITNRSEEDLAAARLQTRSGDLDPIKDLLFESAVLIHTAAIQSLLMGPYSESRLEVAFKAVDKVLSIYQQLEKHSAQGSLQQAPQDLFQNSCLKVLNYISRKKNGTVYRYELLTSRVLPGKKTEYDACINALLESGFIKEDASGQRKMTTYTVVYPENNRELLIEVNQ